MATKTKEVAPRRFEAEIEAGEYVSPDTLFSQRAAELEDLAHEQPEGEPTGAVQRLTDMVEYLTNCSSWGEETLSRFDRSALIEKLEHLLNFLSPEE